jgi:hypothetical protein
MSAKGPMLTPSVLFRCTVCEWRRAVFDPDYSTSRQPGGVSAGCFR